MAWKLITISWGLLEILGVGLFVGGFFAQISALVLIGGLLLVLQDAVQIYLGSLNPLFPIVLEFALTQDEWLTDDPARKRLDTQKAREDKWAMGPPLLPSEAAAILNVHPRTVTNWAREGRIQEWTKTLGGHFRFPRRAILKIRRKMEEGA